MSIVKELLLDEFENSSPIDDFLSKVNVTELIQSKAVRYLTEIQEILKNERLSDFGAIEDIVCVFKKYGLDAGIRHDFG